MQKPGIATIVWVLTHPPELPPLTDTRASKESVKIVRSGMGTTGTARPRVSTKRPERAAVVKQSKKATIRIKRKRPNQTYKIYIDGELAEMENDELQIEAGQHTIHARLLPDDKLTPKRQFDVTAGAVQTLEL